MAAPASPPITRFTSQYREEWELDRLDVGAYLARIGYDGPFSPTGETLRGVHRAHATAIPFENLEIPLGRGIFLDMDRIQAKLVSQRRGGYCFEHNLLFAAALETIGFQVRRLVARVNPDKPGPRTHMTLNVRIDGSDWLADVGFGAALLEPVPLVDGEVVRQGGWRYAVSRRGPDEWGLVEVTDDAERVLYAFTQEPQRHVDYEMYNAWTSTHPASPFVDQVVAIRVTPDARYTLRGRELATTRPEGAPDSRDVDDDELGEVLAGTFGIVLDEADLARLTALSRP